jgi:RNA polymerase primary sigma factor
MVKQQSRNEQITSEDSVQSYFDEIKRNPLLTFDEELELSRLIEAGDASAKQRLIESNLRLVIKIAKQYVCPGVTFLDLVQEGNLGLLQAAAKYDYRKEVRFSTYASWWIKQSITRALANKKRQIRLPHRKEDTLKKIQATYNVLSQRLMRKPRIEEIAEFLGVSREEIVSIMNLSETVVSLDSDLQSDGGTLYDICLDYSYSPDRSLMQKIVHETMEGLLDRLEPREHHVLHARYGLNGEAKQTLKEIAGVFEVSPETVRQIEMRAIRKLRIMAEELRDVFL